MGRNVVSLGGGVGDAGTSFWYTGAGGDLVSDVNIATSAAVVHGGFAADGYTLNTTVYPINVVTLRTRVGGNTTSVGGGVSNATMYNELATASSGAGGYNDSGNTRVTTGTTVTHSTGSVDFNVLAGTTYYYGAYTTAGSLLCFARGGSSGNIYLNGTASSSFAGNRVSGDLTEDSVPNAPGISATTNITQTTATINWTAMTDSGQNTDDTYTAAQILGYNIVYREGTAATSAYTVWNGNTGSNVLSWGLSSLSQNTTYQFRVAGLNRTTNAIQTDYYLVTAQTGTRSSVIQFRTLAAGPTVAANSYTATGKIGVAYSDTPTVTAIGPGTEGSTTQNQVDSISGTYVLIGTIPPGLSFNSATGAITGTPTKDPTKTYSYTASYTFTVSAANRDGQRGAAASQTITISGGDPKVSPSNGTSPTTRTQPKVWNGSAWVAAAFRVWNPSKPGGAGWDVLG